MKGLSILNSLFLAVAGVSGWRTTGTVEYMELLVDHLKDPPFCGIPYNTLDLSRTTGLCFAKYNGDCGSCYEVCGKSKLSLTTLSCYPALVRRRQEETHADTFLNSRL